MNRTYLAILCWLVLLPASLLAQSSPLAASLDQRLKAIVAAHHGDVAFYAEDLKTHESVSLAPDKPVQTASVIKLAILYEALEQARAGKAHLDDTIVLHAAEQVQGSGVLLFFDTPLSLSFKDVLTMMVVMSDNTATNLAIDHLGLANIQNRIVSLGLADTWLYKKVFTPVPPGVVMPPDYKQFGLGKTTARQMTSLMKRLVLCDLAEPGEATFPGDEALCQTALKMLHLQFYRTGIPRYLDAMPGAAGDSVANKTGALDAVRNDVAAISTQNGIIFLSVFTFNNADRSWTQDQEAELTIAKIAQAIVQTWSPKGLAPWPASVIKPASAAK
jgi:beta-lactamase class A